MMNNNPIISVVIPTMDEENGIGDCIRTIQEAFRVGNIDGEIIVSDNSHDKTPDIARELGVQIFTCPELGYSKSLIYGISKARGKYIVIGDADKSYDFSGIPNLVNPLIEEMADLVIGSRLKGDIKKGSMPFLHRYIGNPLITWILNEKLGTHVTDAHSGIRAFSKEVWDAMDLSLVYGDLCSEMLFQFVKQYARIKEIPVSYHPREGSPKAGTLLHGWRAFKFLWVYIIFRRENEKQK